MLIALFAGLMVFQQPMPLVVTLDVSPETTEGQRRIAQAAVEACRGRYPRLGRYTFEGQNGPGVSTRFTYRGELTCLDGPPPQPEGVPVPAGWQASASDEAAARAATMAYFAAIDAGDVAAWEGLMAEGYRASGTTEQRRAALDEFRREAGPPGAHRVIRTTWYANPPGVAPGAYVAVDFDRSYARLNASCGYVAWHRQPDGSLRLVREEIGNDRRVGEQTPEQRAEVRRLLQCRD